MRNRRSKRIPMLFNFLARRIKGVTVTQKKTLLFFIWLSFGVCSFASGNGWKTFHSSNYFSVSYPMAWFQIGISTDRLQLLSSKGGAEGIIIKHGQAQITVMEAAESLGKTLPQVIDVYTRETSVLSQKEVPVDPGRQSCNDLVEVTSKEPALPPESVAGSVPFVVSTDFFCRSGQRTIVTLLRNWEDDRRQPEYQRIAERMARSVRTIRQKP
jgi:hypothetical protein